MGADAPRGAHLGKIGVFRRAVRGLPRRDVGSLARDGRPAQFQRGTGWSVTPGVTRGPGSERGSQDDFWEYGVGVWTRAADWGPRRLAE